MNDEQINEVMRLVRDAVVTNSLFATEQIADMSIVGEAKCALVSYLRTIGDPENTFPLNPNGSSKWAHLQKHDGAEAIGVVFRTGSGSVGSLVDGRVVWADWLARPNGSKPADVVNAELLNALSRLKSEIVLSDIAPDYIESHFREHLDKAAEAIARAESAMPFWPNHPSAISDPLFHQARGIMGTENFGQEEALRLAILHVLNARAESAIDETPAKVSPCAGHAVQQEADEAIGLAQALEQHRARKIVDAVSALPVGGKHEDSPSPFHAGYQLACDEVMHRLLTEEWDGCLTPPGKQEADEAAKGVAVLQFKCWTCLDTGFLMKPMIAPEPPDVKCPNGCLPKKGGA